jgi:hypothetical protein
MATTTNWSARVHPASPAIRGRSAMEPDWLNITVTGYMCIEIP